jgi:hypothetical protein
VSRDTGDGRKTEVSEAGLSVLIDKDVRLWMSEMQVSKYILFEKRPYPLQICMNHVEAVHVHQAASNFKQLNRTSARFCGGDQTSRSDAQA